MIARSVLVSCAFAVVFSLVNACTTESKDPDKSRSGDSDDKDRADAAASESDPLTVDAAASNQDASDAGDGGTFPECHVDAMTWRNGEYQVVAKGRFYTLDGTWKLTGLPTGTKLDDLAGFRDGPCAGQAAGACRIDALTWRADLSSYTVIRGAKFWTLDGVMGLIAPPGAAGEQITVIPTIASGPCAGSAAGTCSVQAFGFRNDASQFFIVRDGKTWGFDVGGNFIGPETGTSLAGVGALAAMCAAAGPGCPVDDVTWRDDLQQWQYLSGGKFWATDLNVSSVPGSGVSLQSLAGLAQGPCAP